MNGSLALERRYRRLLIVFPAGHRREYGDEMIGVLMAATPQGRRRPRLADALDLVIGGLRARFRAFGAGLSDASWPDALAVGSVALPLTLLTALAVNYVWNLVPAFDLADLSDFYLPSLALALPPLIALRYRRTATVVALAAAAWFWFLLLGQLTIWIDGLEASYCVALLVQVIALAASPGPRRAAAVMTWKTWPVLCAAGLAIGLGSIRYPWALNTWQATAVVLGFLAAVGAGLILTLPRPVALRLLALVAIPAVPAAVWVLQFAAAMAGNTSQNPFPALAFLPVLLLACVIAVTLWRDGRAAKRRSQPPALPGGGSAGRP
jgi:hypothetical protein